MSFGDDRSPCTNICRLDPAGAFCLGCGRTPQDIAKWQEMSRAERLEVKALARERLAGQLKQVLKS